MKKFLFSFLISLLLVSAGRAAEKEEYHMIQTENFLKGELYAIGLPDYPPFSYYTITHHDSGSTIDYRNIFLIPLQKFVKKEDVQIKTPFFVEIPTLQKQILDIRSGEAQLFLGTYSHSKLSTGIELVYPAVLSNPLHIIAMPDTQGKITKKEDLLKLRGIRISQETFSDFVERKIAPLKLTSVKTPEKAYELLFTGQADYILGSLYYNRIMASRLGIEQYLAFSKKPLVKIPLFVGISKLTPLFSEYLKFLQEIMEDPKFGKAVKEEVLKAVEAEREKNAGVVPPAFAVKSQIPTPKKSDEITASQNKETQKNGGKVIEKEIKQKTIDEVLDGI